MFWFHIQGIENLHIVVGSYDFSDVLGILSVEILLHRDVLRYNDRTAPKNAKNRQVPGCNRSMHVLSRELWRSLANSGELWRAHNDMLKRTSLTFTRVPAKVRHIHQSSGEGAFCMWVAVRMCQRCAFSFFQKHNEQGLLESYP